MSLWRMTFMELQSTRLCCLSGRLSYSAKPARNVEFSQHLFGCDQQRFRNISRMRRIGPCIARQKNSEPVKRVGKAPSHRFGVP
jgi:hypothetical protein